MKDMTYFDDVPHSEAESLVSYCTHFNKNLTEYSHKVMHVHNPEELAERVKTYINLEWSKD